jgi:hypothetical protein
MTVPPHTMSFLVGGLLLVSLTLFFFFCSMR